MNPLNRKRLSVRTQGIASIVNGFSTSGWGGVAPIASLATQSILSGALTAGVLTTVLGLSGRGAISLLGVTTADATSRTIRMKLTLDGIVVFDSTSIAIVTSGNGGFVVGGSFYSAGSGASFQQVDPIIEFESQCLFEIASSLSETDKLRSARIYRTYRQ